MREKLEYDIPYGEKGKRKFYHVTIEYVYNYVYEENARMSEIAQKVQTYSNRLIEISNEIKTASMDKLKELKEETDKKMAYIDQQKGFFDSQYELINSILEDNGIVDQEVNDKEFWNRKVTAPDRIAFIEAVVKKDIIKGGKSGKK